MSEAILWTALGLIAYTYVGFPLVLLARGVLRRRAVAEAPVTPTVSLVIVAHNEADVIEAKLENVYALDYPPERLQVIVASDGSDDGTNDIIRRFTSRGLLFLDFPRGGKVPALNAAVAHATGEVLVFSDANSMYAPDAVRKLVAPFADPAVGAVGGNQLYLRDGAGGAASIGERLYWRYDRFLKTLQSAAGNMTSATGAIHAIRRELFSPVPLGVSDDFYVSTRAVAHGRRLVFARDALAYEPVAPTDRAELDRKRRIIARALRSLWSTRELFNPFRYGFYALQLVSHKLLRFCVAWLLPVALATSLALYDAGPVYGAIAGVQAAFYLTALAVLALRNTALARYRAFRLVGVPFYVCLSYYAALRAWVQVLGGKRVDLWESRKEAGRASVVAPAGGPR